MHSTSATWLGCPLQTLSFAGRSIARLGSKMGHSKAESVTLQMNHYLQLESCWRITQHPQLIKSIFKVNINYVLENIRFSTVGMTKQANSVGRLILPISNQPSAYVPLDVSCFTFLLLPRKHFHIAVHTVLDTAWPCAVY